MTTTQNSDDLVRDILGAMQRAPHGDAAAQEALKNQSGAGGTATDPAPTAAKPKPKLASEKTEITRPNGEKYYVRMLGEHHDVAVLRKARARKRHPLLTGMPGTGKTALLEAAYCETDAIFTVQGSGDTEWADFIGGYVQLPGGEFVWIDGPLPLAMEAGGILYVDEIALIDPKVIAGVYGVMDGRGELHVTQNPTRGTVKAEPGFFVVAACNPNAPGARMSEALLSRFGIQFEVTTDYELLQKMGVDKRAITCAQNLQGKIETNGAISWAPQFRELIDFKNNVEDFGLDFALRNLVQTAPEMDRSTVADIVSRQFHTQIKGLKLMNDKKK